MAIKTKEYEMMGKGKGAGKRFRIMEVVSGLSSFQSDMAYKVKPLAWVMDEETGKPLEGNKKDMSKKLKELRAEQDGLNIRGWDVVVEA